MNSDLLDALLGRPRWQRDAACIEHPDVSFFGKRGEPTGSAKAICANCLVREQCLAYALDHCIMYGIWGGTSENERKALRRERAAGRRAGRCHPA